MCESGRPLLFSIIQESSWGEISSIGVVPLRQSGLLKIQSDEKYQNGESTNCPILYFTENLKRVGRKL